MVGVDIHPQTFLLEQRWSSPRTYRFPVLVTFFFVFFSHLDKRSETFSAIAVLDPVWI
jgi:hypothetical protein